MPRALSSLIIAKQAVIYFKENNIKDMKNKAAYNLQQSVEMIIKYEIYNCKQHHFTGEIFDHNIDRLIKNFCLPNKIYIPDVIKENAKLYTTWEAESRYCLNFSVRIDTLEKAICSVEKWILQIKPLYKNKLREVNNRLNRG